MNDQQLLELKGWAHQIFEVERKRRGLTKNEMYKRLNKFLHRNPHFSYMNEEEVQKAISVLIKWNKKTIPARRLSVNKMLPQKALNELSKKQRDKILYKELKEANSKVPMSEIRKAIQNLHKPVIPSFHNRVLQFIKSLLRFW